METPLGLVFLHALVSTMFDLFQRTTTEKEEEDRTQDPMSNE